ncbi:hypothetical protein [Glycomyces halotolerans]
MQTHEDLSDENSGTATESEPLHSTDGHETADSDEADRRIAFELAAKSRDRFAALTSRPVIIAAVAAGTAAAVIGAKLAYDQRKKANGYHRAVRQLEDAKDTLIAAAFELPERSRAAVRRVTH